MANFFLLFFSSMFAFLCGNIQKNSLTTDFEGLWIYSTSNAEFNLKLFQNSKALKGMHCSVMDNGYKIDCSEDEISITGTVTGPMITIIYFKSFYSGESGKATLKKVTDTTIEWQIINAPAGEFHIPVSVILKKAKIINSQDTFRNNLFTPIDDLVSITLPKGTRIITHENALAIKLKRRQLRATDKLPQRGNFYSFGDIVIQLSGGRGNAEKDYLEKFKSAMEEMYRLSQPEYFTSEIKMYNRNKALIINYKRNGEDVGYIQLSLLNEMGSKIINGNIEYSKEDREKVLELVDVSLKSLRFKD